MEPTGAMEAGAPIAVPKSMGGAVKSGGPVTLPSNGATVLGWSKSAWLKVLECLDG
jgi:hypothetical protein